MISMLRPDLLLFSAPRTVREEFGGGTVCSAEQPG